jgi:putative exosortase-associated protein (TIGR04073 family)
MSKRHVAIWMIATLALSASLAWARGPFYDESVPARSGRKLLRGLNNTVFFWVEVPKEISRDWQNVDPLSGVVTGTGRGIFKGVQRLGAGLYEVVTFPIDVPAKYQPVVYPETPMEDAIDWGAEDYYKSRYSDKLTH